MGSSYHRSIYSVYSPPPLLITSPLPFLLYFFANPRFFPPASSSLPYPAYFVGTDTGKKTNFSTLYLNAKTNRTAPYPGLSAARSISLVPHPSGRELMKNLCFQSPEPFVICSERDEHRVMHMYQKISRVHDFFAG